MKQYLDVLQDIYQNGADTEGRNGKTRKVFAKQMRFNLEEGFPAVTTKKLAFKQVVAELIWFIRGSSDNNELNKMGCHIWDANAEADYWKEKAKFPGDLGRVYGVQWRHWQKPNGTEIDQLANVINKIKTDPGDRRLIVSAWNPGELDEMALPPCHMMFQYFVTDNKLSLHMYQRSCDMFLGVPFNIASYSLLLAMTAQEVGLTPHECVITLGDAHIYHEHFEAVEEQLERKPYELPQLWLNPEIKSVFDFTPEDIKLENYKHDKTIKAKMAV